MAHKVGIMIDIETLSLAAQAVIWEIGMVSFSLDDPSTYVREFRISLPIQPQLDMNRKIDASTLGYWFKKPESARAAIQDSIEGNYDDLVAFVRRFIREFDTMRAGLGDTEYLTICKGLNFDVPLLTDLITACGETVPWFYRSLNCLRSMSVAADLDINSIPFKDGLTPHRALDDAKHQIHLWDLIQTKLGTGKLLPSTDE